MKDEDYDPDNPSPAYHADWSRLWRNQARRSAETALVFAALSMAFAFAAIFLLLWGP